MAEGVIDGENEDRDQLWHWWITDL